MENEFIICAAILVNETNKIFYGHRHDQCHNALNSELSWTLNRQQIAKIKKTQGFVTSKNRFVDRKEALVIARTNDQVLDYQEIRGEELYSEDLY